ncbi:hypothetical protein J4468_01780 [Candidatus Woesearchaeota archaeon]|nr:hypothetical protein [Candidatus Woesearchaeota archaeon]
MIQYFLLSIIAFSGLIAGIIIGHYTKEEYSEQNKYYKIVMQATCLILGAIVVLRYNFSLLNLALVVIGLITGFFLYDSIYLFLGMILATGYNWEFSYILFSLVFVIGLPAGTLLKEKSIKNIIFIIALFVLPLMLIFVPQANILGLFAGAALFSIAIRKKLGQQDLNNNK